MSSSSEKFSGQRGMRTVEKPSSFTQTCSMLCQYLKEEGSFGDLNLDMACNNMQQSNGGAPEMFHQKAPPMNFFSCMETSRNMPTAASDFKSMDLFPQQAGFGPSAPTPREEVLEMADSSVKKSAPGEPQKAQMTIFYDGQVIVFNDFPADKAKEVMLLASKESSQRHTTPASTPANINNVFASHLGKSPINSSSSVPPSTNMFPKFDNQAIQEGDKPPPRPIVCDLPLARKASLHRFLEKRKDRKASETTIAYFSLQSSKLPIHVESNVYMIHLIDLVCNFSVLQAQHASTVPNEQPFIRPGEANRKQVMVRVGCSTNPMI